MQAAGRSRARTVALVGSYPPPHGGQSVHISNLRDYLLAQGLEVRVFNTGLNKELRDEGVVNIRSSRSLLKALLLGGTFDLLHAHVSSVTDFGKLAPVALAARIRGERWLVTIHSGDSVEQLRAATPMRRAAARALLATAWKLIGVSPTIGEGLAALTGPEPVVVIPPHSVGLAEARLPALLEPFFADHAPVISCTGLFEPVYGFDQAVRLMVKVREVHPRAGLLLIGDTRDAAWCRSLVKELGLERQIRLCGNLSHQECLAAMRRSALFLRPTLYDGDSLSVREALALGVPVLASATDFRPDGVPVYQPGDFEGMTSKALAAVATPGADVLSPGSDNANLEKVLQLYLAAMGA